MVNFKVGDKVKVLGNDGNLNPVGSVGIITLITSIVYGKYGNDILVRVQVEGHTDNNLNNWHDTSQLKVLLTTQIPFVYLKCNKKSEL